MKRAVYIVSGMNAGGAETVMMKFYRKLDKTKYQMDFCVSQDEKGFYDDEIEALGGHVIHTVKKTKNPFKSFMRLHSIAKEQRYYAALRSTQRSISALDLVAMRLGGIGNLVFRSSNTGTTQGGKLETKLHKFFLPFARLAATKYIAPSTEAGLYMFGKKGVASPKFSILHNALDLEEYAYSDEHRSLVRSQLGIADDTFLVGHVGRFNQQKNHLFLLEVFSEVLKGRPNSMLVLFGQGELEANIKEKIGELGLEDKVIFAGVRSDANRCYSAIDVLLFPSLYEGMPNVIIEAQANGLPCLISDTITKEVLINKNVNMCSLQCAAADWAHRLIGLEGKRCVEPKEAMRAAGYSIDDEIHNFIKVMFDE